MESKFNSELKEVLLDRGLVEESISKLETVCGVIDEAGLIKLVTTKSDDQIVGYIGCTILAAQDLIAAYTPAKPEPISEVVTSNQQVGSLDLLPAVPENDSFLELLKVGGVLKVGKIEVISAIKAAIAASLGLYDLPDTLKKLMEDFAETQEEPVTEQYFELQNMITTRNYAEVLSVLKIAGNFMTETRKKAFLGKLNTELWEAIRSFQIQLSQWQEKWLAGISNPGMLLAAMGTGKAGLALPPGMMQPPDASDIRDEAEAVINRINKVFAGVGIPVARALAYEATRIKGILEAPGLPAAIGATNKDQMLKTIGIAVGADYVRLERNITRFALSIMELPNVAAGNEELAYLSAMIQLSLAIPWDKLTNMSNTTVIGKTGREATKIGARFPDEKQ